MLITILVFLAVLSILVTVHELGHFIAARKFGAKAEEFGLGFPPRLIGLYKSLSGKWKFVFGNREVADAADTVYSLNLLPIGGFVRISGENGEEAENIASFAAKKAWQRSVILAAGVTMNVVLACVLIIINLMIGANQEVGNGPVEGTIIGERHVQVLQVSPQSPAEQAGLQMGDAIIAVNGQKVESNEQLQGFVADKPGEKLTYDIKRGKQDLQKEVTPIFMPEINRAGIGVAIAETAFVRYPFFKAIVEGVKLTGYSIVAVAVGFYDVIHKLVTSGTLSRDVGGPIMIAVVTGQAATLGFSYLLQVMTMLSLSLAVINILPIPGLDGGRLLFILIEKLKGGPVKQTVEAVTHNIGLLLLIGLMILVTYKDVMRYIIK